MPNNKHDTFIAEIQFKADQMEAGVKRAGQVLENFDNTSTRVFEQFAKSAELNMKRAGKEFERETRAFQKQADEQAKALKRLTDQMQNTDMGDLSGQFQDFAGRGQQMVGSFLGAATQMEQFRLTLVTLLGSAEAADKELAKLQKYAELSPFDLQSVVAAGVQLRSFKVDVERFLPLAGDLASVFNRDVKDSALALGKALGGSSEGMELLQDAFGIGRAELKKAGAIFKDTGALANGTATEVAALASALEKVAKEKGFTGAAAAQMATLQGASSQAADAVFNLTAAIGSGLAPAFTAMAKVTTTTVNAATGLPPVLLAAAGGAVALGTAVATGGAALLGLQATLATLVPYLGGTALGFTAAEIAAGAVVASFGTLALLGGTLVAGAAAVAVALNSEAEAAEAVGEQIKKQSAEVTYANGVFQQYRDAIEDVTGASQDFVTQGQSVEQTARSVGEALAGLSGAELLRALEKAGIKLADVSTEMGNAKKNGDALRLEIRDVNKAISTMQALDSGKGLPREIFSSEELAEYKATLANLFPDQTFVSMDNLLAKQKELNTAYKETRQVEKGLLKPIVDNGDKAASALKAVADGAKTLAGDLKVTVDTADLKSLDDGYAKAQKSAQAYKTSLKQTNPDLDTSSLTGLKKELASGSGATEAEKTAIRELIALIELRNGYEKQGQAIRDKGARESLASQLEEVRSLDTARQRLAALQKIAAAEGLGADAKKQVNAQIRQEQQKIRAEEERDHKERVAQDIFEAQNLEGTSQQKIAALQRVIDQHKLEGAEQRRILKEIDSLKDDVAKKEEARRQAEADGLAGENQRQQELLIAALEDRISHLQEEADAGKNVQAELVAAMEERTAREIALIEERTQARAEEADSAKVADAIEVTGALEVDAARRSGTEAIEDQRKAQEARIAKIREERQEALKAAKDEKKARGDVEKTIRGQSQGSTSTGPAMAPSSQGWSNPIPNSPFVAPPTQSFEQMAASLPKVEVDWNIDKIRAQTDEIRANRVVKEEERHAAFEAGNPELVARIFDEDVKRREALSKKDAERQEAARKTVEADLAADSAKRARAQELADGARRSAAISQTNSGRLFGGLTREEIEKKFQYASMSMPKADLSGRNLSQPKFDASRFTMGEPKRLNIVDPVQAMLDKAKASGRPMPGQAGSQKPAASSSPTNGRLTVELEIKGAQVVGAKVKGKSADLDGKVGDLQRQANKISFGVNT